MPVVNYSFNVDACCDNCARGESCSGCGDKNDEKTDSFALSFNGNRVDAPDCQVGTPCGDACIPEGATCHEGQGEVNKAAMAALTAAGAAGASMVLGAMLKRRSPMTAAAETGFRSGFQSLGPGSEPVDFSAAFRPSFSRVRDSEDFELSIGGQCLGKRQDGERMDAPNCQVGTPCGEACIPEGDTCHLKEGATQEELLGFFINNEPIESIAKDPYEAANGHREAYRVEKQAYEGLTPENQDKLIRTAYEDTPSYKAGQAVGRVLQGGLAVGGGLILDQALTGGRGRRTVGALGQVGVALAQNRINAMRNKRRQRRAARNPRLMLGAGQVGPRTISIDSADGPELTIDGERMDGPNCKKGKECNGRCIPQDHECKGAWKGKLQKGARAVALAGIPIGAAAIGAERVTRRMGGKSSGSPGGALATRPSGSGSRKPTASVASMMRVRGTRNRRRRRS